MSAPTIASEWEHFKGLDIAPDAPPEQLFEMRKAFYAGVASGAKLQLMNGAALLLEMRECIAAEDARRRRALL